MDWWQWVLVFMAGLWLICAIYATSQAINRIEPFVVGMDYRATNHHELTQRTLELVLERQNTILERLHRLEQRLGTVPQYDSDDPHHFGDF